MARKTATRPLGQRPREAPARASFPRRARAALPRATPNPMSRTAGLRRLVHLLRETPAAVDELVRWLPDWGAARETAGGKRLKADARLRVVALTPYQFVPVQHGGGTLILHALRALATRGHDVSVVGFVDSEEWVRAAEPLREFCREVRLLIRPQRALPEARLRVAPLQTVLFEMPELRAALDQVIAAQDADVLQIEYTQLASFARPAPRHVACVTAHDVAFVSQYRRALAEAGGEKAELESFSEYLRTFHHEVTALRRCDAVFPVTAHDGRLLRRYLGRGAHVSNEPRTGVDVERLGAIPRAPEPASLLFVGFFLHPPNVDAILWFAREVLPRVHRLRPDARLTIVGAEPPEEVRRLADDPRVEVAGFVPELDRVYGRSTAMVAPIRMGAGVRIKILEAFAAGLPVVSTRMGAEGIDAEDGRELLVAEDAATMADKTVRLLDDRALQADLSRAARAWVGRAHAWPAIAAGMEREYRAALVRRGLMEAP